MAVYARYSWSRPSSPTPAVPIVAAIDPAHATPEPDANPIWRDGTMAPSLPDTLVGDLGGGPIGGGGPVDVTPGQHAGHSPDPVGIPPGRSQFGVGSGPGLSTLESQDVRGDLMGRDLGAVDSRRYQPMTDRTDGSGPWSAVLTDEPGHGDSPAQIQHELTGVGAPDDPFARTGKRVTRGWSRNIDMHRWPVQYRPMLVKQAKIAQPQPASPVGNQFTRPYDSAATYNPSTPDSFVAPMERQSPAPWDAGMTVSTPVNDSGLPVWGL